jgi:hypothetical protein
MRDVVLELTADNADVETATAAAVALSLDEDASSLAARWENSVVAVWTPTAHASGFVIDANGLIVTNQRAIGLATSVEVQFSPTLKVAGSVVAVVHEMWLVVRIDPMIAAAVSVPLGCGDTVPVLNGGGSDLRCRGAPSPPERNHLGHRPTDRRRRHRSRHRSGHRRLGRSGVHAKARRSGSPPRARSEPDSDQG